MVSPFCWIGWHDYHHVTPLKYYPLNEKYEKEGVPRICMACGKESMTFFWGSIVRLRVR